MAESDVEVKFFFVKNWGKFRFIFDKRRRNRKRRRGQYYSDKIRWIKSKTPPKKLLIHKGRKA